MAEILFSRAEQECNRMEDQSDKAAARARQFVLTSLPEPTYPTWFRVRFSNDLYFDHEPHLHVAVSSNRQCLLAGSIFDLLSDTRNLDTVISAVESLISDDDQLFERLSHLAGRWVFIWRNGETTRIISDATGLLPVFYTTTEPKIIVSCNPELIAELGKLGISKDGQARMAEPNYRIEPPKNIERNSPRHHDNWWPGELTPFEGIRHLLPNHSLEVKSCRIQRFWPTKPIRKNSLSFVAAEGSKLLHAIISGLIRSGPVLMPMSAGLDTRTLLSVCKTESDQLKYFVYGPGIACFDDSYTEDRKIAGTLSQRFGLSLTELEYADTLEPRFRDRFLSNLSFITSSQTIAFELQAMTRTFPENITLVNGNVSEVARNFFGFVPHRLVSPDYLTSATDPDLSALVKGELAHWLPDARRACAEHGIELTDLLYWEFRMGCWQSYVQLQIGAFFEVFTPYNCRKLLEILLSAPKRYRCGVLSPLYREIIRTTWPELLDIPVNPTKSRKLKTKIRAFVRGHRLINYCVKSLAYAVKSYAIETLDDQVS